MRALRYVAAQMPNNMPRYAAPSLYCRASCVRYTVYYTLEIMFAIYHYDAATLRPCRRHFVCCLISLVSLRAPLASRHDIFRDADAAAA